jgi:hypothetical protein
MVSELASRQEEPQRRRILPDWCLFLYVERHFEIIIVATSYYVILAMQHDCFYTISNFIQIRKIVKLGGNKPSMKHEQILVVNQESCKHRSGVPRTDI